MNVLAEIGDKIPTVPGTFVLSTLTACVLGGIARLHRYLLALPVLVLVLSNYSYIQELREPGWGKMIVEEMGYSYVVGMFWSMNLPVVVSLVVLFRLQRADARRKRDQQYARCTCQHCGYDLTGNVSGVCPECATPVADGRGQA